ncbi:MAG: hypothetical protein FJW83_11865 [Actinobacteria bacterium]|nr:hypothetical protein [Actinomycetota bacterium]
MTTEESAARAWSAVGELHHRYLTGALLGLVQRHGETRAAAVCEALFRRQHLEAFLPGLTKLGLTGLPHAVACAQYHVLSNALGGVRVVWIPESDRKSWVRYLPPRWIFDGTAVAGIPTDVSRAMLRGWHAHNGPTLGNPRLGFVCTMQTVDGQPGLEGYYIEEDEPLEPHERLRFRPGERPLRDPEPLPLPNWDPVRLAKVERNYALAYTRSLLAEVGAVLGPLEGAHTLRLAGRQVAMQYRPTIDTILGEHLDAPGLLLRMLRAQDDDAERVEGAGGIEIRSATCRTTDGLHLSADTFEGWNGIWEGFAALDGLRLDVVGRADLGDPAYIWRFRPMPGPLR